MRLLHQPECIRLVNELVTEHGDVKYIILPTISGLEHKVFVGPFARFFPNAQVFVAPKQWSFPLNLAHLAGWVYPPNVPRYSQKIVAKYPLAMSLTTQFWAYRTSHWAGLRKLHSFTSDRILC